MDGSTTRATGYLKLSIAHSSQCTGRAIGMFAHLLLKFVRANSSMTFGVLISLASPVMPLIDRS